MSLLQTVEPEQAQGEVAEVYQILTQAIGLIPNAMKMLSINPMALRHTAEAVGYAMHHPSLSPMLFTMIRQCVSSHVGCQYCITVNRGLLLQMGLDMDAVLALENNPATAPLDDKEKALLLYTIRAVKNSNQVGETDVETLRKLGINDLEIFDALNHGARQVAADIMINALKVESDF
ncbi:carboxymuconolactone decarboxylase family protein [Thiothrix nivea]|uniref:Alkylhydroperoxidase like protein, AhpD family n=1 Tax=Thiothrix nivea (strain ATCC 35100 / DSM 5205 / JP2) TaxID=870187 RepID=A0A656HF03_THINJ|nr:carboxymuconolactone decarboxylase family protein [Thiothrix nivea]EIJ34782.1 hypothetical protein Thini_2217 [Thiothrix nivea DSM 5205]